MPRPQAPCHTYPREKLGSAATSPGLGYGSGTGPQGGVSEFYIP